MGRRYDKMRVARAGLYGARQRLADIERRPDLTAEQKVEHRTEALKSIKETTATIEALGGDPDDATDR